MARNNAPPASRREHVELSLVPVAIRIFLTLFLLDSMLILAILVILRLNPSLHLGVSAALITVWVLHTILFIVAAYFILAILVGWGLTRIYVDYPHRHLIMRRGLLVEQEKIYELDMLEQISLEQGILARRCNYGNLMLKFGGAEYDVNVELRDIRNPGRYEQLLEGYLQPPTG